MKHRKRIKANKIWNRFICPVINVIAYIIFGLFPYALVIGLSIFVELISG